MKRFAAIFLILLMIFSAFSCQKAPEEDASLGVVVPDDKEEVQQDAPQQEEEAPAEKEEAPKEEEQAPAEKEEAPAEKEEAPKEEEQAPAEKEEEPVEKEEQAIDYSKWIKVASYNIKVLNYGTQLQEISEELKAINADIVGVQEVDWDTTRSGPGNQIQMLAEAAGYPYWAFTKLIDHQGGQYGMGILSRFPIKESTDETYKVLASGDHLRKFGRHVLDVNGKELVLYNTHLTLGNVSENGAELRQVTLRMAKDPYAVLTGDMNMNPDGMERYVDTKKLTVLNGGDEFVFSVNTFPAGNKPTRPIDNIVVTDTMDYYWNDNTNVGIEVNHTDNSDHNLIWTYVNFK